MFFFHEEGNFLSLLNKCVERTAATRDWRLLLQSVCTRVSSSHVDLLEQKKVFTKEKSWEPPQHWPTCPPIHRFGTSIWLLWHNVHICTLYIWHFVVTASFFMRENSGNFKNWSQWDLCSHLQCILGLPNFELDVRNTPPHLDPSSLSRQKGESRGSRCTSPKMLSGILYIQTAANKLENLTNFYWINESCILNVVKYCFATY